MQISATIKNKFNTHETILQTNGDSKTIQIPSKTTGYGSSINGGEFLLLSLATCFCNDIYREANKRKILISEVEVEFTGEFGTEGEPGSNFRYKAIVKSDASPEEIIDLIKHTDRIAEVHNTLRKGLSITLTN